GGAGFFQDVVSGRADRLAHRLCEFGVGHETLVGICVERGVQMMIGILAILKAGGAYVPLDPGYPPERLAFMLADSKAKIVLSEKRTARLVSAPGANIVLLDDETPWSGASSEDLKLEVTPEDLCYV